MHISPITFNALNFKARLTRNTVYEEGNNGEIHNRSTTKKELVESYNSQIKALRAQRDAAIELDTFMRSDKMKMCLDKLPKGDEIEMISSFSSLEVDEDGNTKFNPICLMYKFEDPISRQRVEDAEYLGSNMADELTMCYVQNEDGSIDKRKILNYIVSIGRFLGVAKR